MRHRRLVGALAALVASWCPAPLYAGPEAAATSLAEGVGRDLVPVARVPYAGGGDLEFTTIGGRDYAVATSMKLDATYFVVDAVAGVRLVDITNPERPRVVGFLECSVGLNDVQVRGRYAYLGVDGWDAGVTGAECFRELRMKPAYGLLVIDIGDPRRPRSVGFAPVKYGVHNSTLHPGGRYVYASDNDILVRADEGSGRSGRVQVIDVGNPRAPRQVAQLGLPVGVSSHDVTFNKRGDRAYVAAVSESFIVDTTDPVRPFVKTVVAAPILHHAADPSPDGRYLFLTDEQAGAAANGVCNAGGVHVFDITDESAPRPAGVWTVDPATSALATTNSGNVRCTAHVLDFAPDGKTWSNGVFAAGVRVVSATEVLGRPKELAYFVARDADTWSAKTYRDRRYVFANDLTRGLDVFKWVPGLGPVDTRRGDRPLVFRGQPRAGSYCYTA